jgi:hypothetical protein
MALRSLRGSIETGGASEDISGCMIMTAQPHSYSLIKRKALTSRVYSTEPLIINLYGATKL